VEIFQRLNTLEPGAVAAEDLTPEELPFLSLLPALALIFHLIDGVDTGRRGPVSGAAAARAAAWCEYLAAHARRLYGAVTDAARVAAALLATRLAGGRLASPFTAREVYRQEWTGLTEPRVVLGALECLEAVVSGIGVGAFVWLVRSDGSKRDRADHD